MPRHDRPNGQTGYLNWNQTAAHGSVDAFASCIVAIPLVAAANRFTMVWVLSGIVLAECLILAVNHGRCPLTDLAATQTTQRIDNFDIYLPLWLARYNKIIFGSLFVASEIFLLVRWVISQAPH